MTLVISNPCDNLNHYCYIFFFITYVKNNITFYSKALWGKYGIYTVNVYQFTCSYQVIQV